MGLDSPPSPAAGTGWSQVANAAEATNQAHDAPSLRRPLNNLYLKKSDDFNTYLMYRAVGADDASNITSVWVATSELDWSWSEFDINTGTPEAPNWGDNTARQPLAPNVLQPTGPAAFPTWKFDIGDDPLQGGL